MSTHWSSDTPISMPRPAGDDPLTEAGAGFVFTQSGLAPHLTEEEAKVLSRPTFEPENVRTTEYADGGR